MFATSEAIFKILGCLVKAFQKNRFYMLRACCISALNNQTSSNTAFVLPRSIKVSERLFARTAVPQIEQSCQLYTSLFVQSICLNRGIITISALGSIGNRALRQHHALWYKPALQRQKQHYYRFSSAFKAF